MTKSRSRIADRMSAGRALVVAAGLLALPLPTLAQQHQPIGRFVIDVHGTSAGLPTGPGWTPDVSSDTELPSRAIGLDFGGHVYLVRFRRAALGVGATWGLARGRTRPVDVPEGTTNPIFRAPEVTTRLTALAPQLSLNFGHSLGWSYLSAGLGRTRVESEAVATTGTIQYAPRDSDWTKTLNFGGGARWFINDHLGVGFDLRWHKVSIVPASSTRPAAPRASLVTAGVGLSIK